MRKKRVAKAILIAAIAIPLFGWVVMSLWNWLMPAVFAVKPIGFWQALGLFLLSRILFGGFGGNGGRRHRPHRMMEQWELMTPEERVRFRTSMERWHAPAPKATE